MKRAWFGSKTFGIGAMPRSWEGWAVTLAFVAGLVMTVRFLGPWLRAATGFPQPLLTFGVALVWIAGLVGVIALTYDKDA